MLLEIEFKTLLRSDPTSYAGGITLEGLITFETIIVRKKLVYLYQEQNYLVITCNGVNYIKNILQTRRLMRRSLHLPRRKWVQL